MSESTLDDSKPVDPSGSTEEKKPSFHVPSLDGWRAVAVSLVVVAHCGFTWACGFLGVTFFFVISGFLITTLLRREFDRKGKIDFKSFYIRRVLRIFPPMYLTLIASVVAVLTGALTGVIASRGVVMQFFNLSNYASAYDNSILPGTGVMWSLAVEEHFYLLWPITFVFVYSKLSKKSALRLIIGTCILILIWRWMVPLFPGVGVPEGHRYLSSDTRIDGILWGCALALFANPYYEGEKAAKIGRPWMAWTGAIAILFTIVLIAFLQRKGLEDTTKNTWAITVQILGFIPILVGSILYPDKAPFKWLNAKWVVWVGTVSYGIYLYHYFVLAFFDQHTHLPAPVLLVCVTTITLLVAALSMKFMEGPAGRLRKRFSQQAHG